MREVDAKHTAPARDHLLKYLNGTRGRTYGRNNFGAIQIIDFVIFFHLLGIGQRLSRWLGNSAQSQRILAGSSAGAL